MLCLSPIPACCDTVSGSHASSCDAVSGTHTSCDSVSGSIPVIVMLKMVCLLSGSQFLCCWRWSMSCLILNSCDVGGDFCLVWLPVLVTLKMVCVLSRSNFLWCAGHWKRWVIVSLEVTIKEKENIYGKWKWCWRWIELTMKVNGRDDEDEWK